MYRIDSVKTGQHQVYIDLLSVRADLTLLDGEFQTAKLESGHDMLVDFRLVRTGRVTGTVWLDANGNGKIDDGETLLAGVRVVTSSGRDTLTDETGNYTISDLTPGEHVVLIDEKTLPAKTNAGGKPLNIAVTPGRETPNANLSVINTPAEVKIFSRKN